MNDLPTVIRNRIKGIRTSQPFNYLATSATRAVFNLTRTQPEPLIKHLHRVGMTRTRLPNGQWLRLWSRGDDWVSNQVFWRGWDGYEQETVPLFYRLAQRVQVTFDIGAYVGYFTLLAAHANTKGRVYAFEPMPGIFRRLQRNVVVNNLSRRVQITQAAVGKTNGEAEFFHMKDLELPSSSSLSYEFMEGAKGLIHSKVPVVTLDCFARDNGIERVDLLKIDTESTEPDVLRGMTEILRRDHPTIICEVLQGRGSGESLQEILEPLGYRFYLLTSSGPQLHKRIEGHPEYLNYLFTTLEPSEVRCL